MATDQSPQDQMFSKGGKSCSSGNSFAKAHKKGGAMHKKIASAKMSQSHGKGASKK